MPSNLQNVNEAHKRREQFLEVHGASRLIEIRLLHMMWRKKDYENLGFDSFKSYWEAPRDSGGLDISQSWAIELIKTYQKYVVELHQPESILEECSPRKLYYLKGEATEANVADVINRAKNTSLADLMAERRDEDINCEHRNLDFLAKCRDCRQWLRYQTRSELFILKKLLEAAVRGE